MPSLLSMRTIHYSLWDQRTESSSPRQENDMYYACNPLWAVGSHVDDKLTLRTNAP